MKNKQRNTLHAIDVLNSFGYIISKRGEDVVPLFVYYDKDINELLYKYYEENNEFFSDNFKPELDGNYPRMSSFYRCMSESTQLIIGNPEVRRLYGVNESFIQKLTKPALGLILDIGENFEYNFGCNFKGDVNYRTEMKDIQRGQRIMVPTL